LVRGAENEPGLAADALRAVLATNAGFIEGLPFPKSGWTRVVDTTDEVQFVALERRQVADRPWYLIAFELRNGRWKGLYMGECRLHPAALENGFGAGEWWLAKSAEPTDRILSAFVREGGCTVGPARPAMIGTPIIAPRGDVVKVVIPVRFTHDGRCTAATPTTIDVGQLLGNRRLLDAGVFPARDAQVSPPCPIGTGCAVSPRTEAALPLHRETSRRSDGPGRSPADFSDRSWVGLLPGRLVHRGRGFGPVAVTSRCGTQSST
jgi:hypothetical protein